MPEKKPRKICVILVDRANYGRLKPVMQAIQNRSELHLQVIASGTMVLERFGYPVNIVREDDFPIDGEIFIEVEGSIPATMAKSVGFAVIEFSSEFKRLNPDIVLVIGDRYEALAAAIAAAFMNITIVHIQGGEVSGSIDESIRHAITKFAQYHFPSTKRSAEFLIRMGERPDTILGVGCPSSDIARLTDTTLTSEIVNSRGSGIKIDVERPFILVVFHPTTTEYGTERDQMLVLLEALAEIKMQTLLLWPNIDAGSDHISKVIRVFRDKQEVCWMRNLTNLSPENYLKVLANATCGVGNSSSFVRDASFLGTPMVLVGSRQDGRETDEHVLRVSPVKEKICQAVKRQLEHGYYKPSILYGDGNVSQKIADSLVDLKLYVQKRLNYLEINKFIRE